jgi:hypothetical protein
MAKIPEDAQQKDVATFDGFGHLQGTAEEEI